MPESRDLVAHARDTRVVVVGGGIAGAVAALECARVGMSVTLLEAQGALGGTLRAVELAGVAVDAHVDGFAPGTPELSALLADLELDGDVVGLDEPPMWISGLPGRTGTVRVAADSVLGIPANPWDAEVRRVIGWGGAWRAYVDRLRPPLTIGRERNLGALVRTRMGDAVCDRLVAPVTRATLGLEPHEVDADLAAPGLNAALTTTGSLAGAAASLGGAASPGGPAPRRATLAGGLHRLPAALAERLEQFDVDVRTGARATDLARADDAWVVAAHEMGEQISLTADAVVLAIPAPAARHLLTGIVALPEPPADREVDVVVLRLRGAGAGEVGRRGVVAPVTGDTWRVVDLAAFSPAIADVSDDELIVRVEGLATDGAEEAVVARALAAASSAFGVELHDRHLRAVSRTRATWHSAAQRDRLERAHAVRRALDELPTLAATGAWLSGDGLERVVADAVAEADRLRSRVLWGEGSGRTGP
jgi:oxygen-dependent protoporphyrinogen oxidase